MDDSQKKKLGSWHQRTRLEKILIVLMVLTAIFVLFLSLRLIVHFRNGRFDNVCVSEKCIRTSASILENMDAKIDPCEDFYKFACGKFLQNAVIPDDATVVTTASNIINNLQMKLRKILDEKPQKTDSKHLIILKTVYTSCMNTTRIEKDGLDPMRKIFKDLGGWPVVEGDNWNERDFDWKKLLYRLRSLGLRQNMFFNVYIAMDEKNSTRRMLTISQECLSYEQIKNESYVENHHQLMTDIAIIYGADENRARNDMKEVMGFIKDIANITVPFRDRKNSSLEYNLMRIRDLQRDYPFIPWLQYINSYLSPYERMYADEYVNVAIPKFLTNILKILRKTNKRVLANYMFYSAQSGVNVALPQELQRRNDDFANTVWGRSSANPRWKTCVWQTYSLNVALSAVYVRNYFRITSKRKVVELVSDIKNSFHETLNGIGWMDKDTKKHALIKAEKMIEIIGYPEQLMYDETVDKEYVNLDLNPNGRFMDIKLNLSLFYHNEQVRKLRDPIEKPNWRDYAYTYHINAFYNQQSNAIELPAGILQAPFFDEDRPQYVNYGAIGYIIGHEITHGFDDSGRQYDQEGNLIDWWDPHTNKTFSNKAQCLVEQYKNHIVTELGVNLNGVNNLGENIADNSGIMIAYRGYERWLARNGGDELALPGLPYNVKQMFWLSAAHPFCARYKEETLKNMIVSGVHAPWHFRVIVPFMNSEAFAKDFDCPLGSRMNPQHKCRVW